MKKLTFLTMILALFTSANVFAQNITGAKNCPTPQAIQCLSHDALHPIAGTEYTYSVNVPSPAGDKNYHWIVTQDVNFIQSGNLTNNIEDVSGDLLIATGTAYNDATNTSNSVKLTWESFNYDPTNPVFVVIKVVNTPTDGSCTTENLKVYKIEQKNAFTLDIANMKEDGNVLGYGKTHSSCVSGIESAQYDATTQKIEYDYGVNYIYYGVTAANFTDAWKPAFQISGDLTASQTVSIDWSYDGTSNWQTTTYDNGNDVYNSSTNVAAQATGGVVSSTGECIVVRVTVKNNNYETLTDQNVTLAVDGKTNLTAAPANQLPDVHHATGAQCGQEDGFDNDTATHVIKQRPTVDSTTQNANGSNEDFIPAK